MSARASHHRRALPEAPARRGWCPGLARPMPTGDGLLARVHPPLGILTLDQARAVSEGARRFGNGHIDLTARANLQIRGVTEATQTDLARLLAAEGLGDMRTDGGPQRLTLTGPLADRDPDALIDVSGLARAVEAAGLAIPGLPAKTLVVIAGRRDVAMPEADCRVVAREPGIVTIVAGQEQEEIVACAEGEAPARVAALLAAFASTGRRRMRDLSDAERAIIAAALSVRDPAGIPAQASGRGDFARDDAPFAPAPGLHARPGLHILAIDAAFGRCTAAAFDRVVTAAVALGASDIRLSSTRGFVLATEPRLDTRVVLADLATDFITAPGDPRRRIDACTGAPGCASGSTPTLADAARLAEAFRPLPASGGTAHVSGCAKGCARPGPAGLTLVGRDGRYGIVLGGAPADEPAMDLPIEAVLERLGRAKTVGLTAAFAPDTAHTQCGRTRRPA